MGEWVKKALTRRRRPRGSLVHEPDPRLVLGMEFVIAMTVCLCGLEIAHLAFLHAWNSEIFAAITGLIGMISGVFVSQKAG